MKFFYIYVILTAITYFIPCIYVPIEKVNSLIVGVWN